MSTSVLLTHHTTSQGSGRDSTSCGKMTAAVMGQEKIVLGKLVNNNNVKGRVAQFSKNEDGWRPPQTFAVGFWANREKSGSTLTLYEDIVSSDSEDEETSRQSNKIPLYQIQQNFSRTAAHDMQTSYKQLGSSLNMHPSSRHRSTKPPEVKQVNKMQYCQDWLAPQHVQPIIGNVGSGKYNRLQSTSKWDARHKVSQQSAVFNSVGKTTSMVYNSQNVAHKSIEVVNLRKTSGHQIKPAQQSIGQSIESIYENTRPVSQQSNSSSDSSSQRPKRSSRPSSVGSVGSRPLTPGNEAQGPSSSPNPVSHSSTSSSRKQAQHTRSTPISTNSLLSNQHSIVSPFATAAASSNGSYSRLQSKSTVRGTKSSKPTRDNSKVLENWSTSSSPYPVQRSNSADSVHMDRSSDVGAKYKTEVLISVNPSHGRDGDMPPIPAPRRVKRTKSSTSCRPQSLQTVAIDEEAARLRRPSGHHEFKQKFTCFTGDDDVIAATANQTESEVTDVNLFNVNEAAIIESKRIVSSSPFIRDNTESRNLRNHQCSQDSLQDELRKKQNPPDIIPRNLASSDRSRLSKLDVSRAVSVNSVVESEEISNCSPIYDNLINFNNNNREFKVPETGSGKSALAPFPSSTRQSLSGSGVKSSWDKLSLTPIEFHAQCAQVRIRPCSPCCLLA